MPSHAHCSAEIRRSGLKEPATLARLSMCESVFKVLVIGEPKVGKTAFVARYCTREWLSNYKTTIGGTYSHPDNVAS